MKTLSTLLITFALLFSANTLFAQVDGTINANATVLESITVDNINDLEFGDVEIGNSSEVLPTAANAGQFNISGTDGRDVSFSFTTLPTELTDGSNTITITFGASSAQWDNGDSSAAFDPNSDAPSTSLFGGDVDVFIGGEVDATGAEAGDYTGSITLTAEYQL